VGRNRRKKPADTDRTRFIFLDKKVIASGMVFHPVALPYNTTCHASPTTLMKGTESTMRRLPYDDYNKKEMILRDFLAMDRTVFAGTRTFLGYIRVTLTLVIATLIFIRIFNGHLEDHIFYLGFILALIILAAGISLYLKIKTHHKDLQRMEAYEKIEDDLQ
jgi:putative membrane protein